MAVPSILNPTEQVKSASADVLCHWSPKYCPMCGRFTLRTSAIRVAKEFRLPLLPEFPIRWNIGPGQMILCVRTATDGSPTTEATLLKWGLIPSWARDSGMAARLINARSETASEKPSFRSAFQQRRCLIPADGFYEWKPLSGGRKQPWLIQQPDQSLLTFAGLWESWSDPAAGQVIETCTILTTTASTDLQCLHERMPVILPRQHHDTWLSPLASPGQLRSLMVPLPEEMLQKHPVSDLVNKIGNDQPECVEAVAELPDQTGPTQRTLF